MSLEPFVVDKPAPTAQVLVDGIDRLIALPEVWIRINRMIREQRSAAEIARAVEMDTDLSARLLRIVNSAFYRLAAPVETISRAITIIGTGDLRDLALVTVARRLFTGIPRELMDIDRYWRMAVGTGVYAGMLGRKCGVLHAERVFVMGVLHDIGVLAICRYIPHQAREILLIAADDLELLPGAELEVLGYTHQDVGAALLQRWGLPASMVEVAAHHHDPHLAADFALEVSIVHVASLLAGGDFLGLDAEAVMARMNPEAVDLVRPNIEMLEQIRTQGGEQVEEMVERFLSPGGQDRRSH